MAILIRAFLMHLKTDFWLSVSGVTKTGDPELSNLKFKYLGEN